jgi:ribosomal protein S18 acetylase RimI-like enzyme
MEVANLSFAEEFEVSGFDPNHIENIVDQIFGIPGRIFLWTSRMIGVEPFKLFVAEVSNRVVGTTLISREGKVAYVSTVMVHPDFRRQGTGRTLVQNALEYVQGKRMKRAILHVIPTNSPAKNLYVNLGFKDFERIVRFSVNTELMLPPQKSEGVKISSFKREHTLAVFDLVRASEDPRHLEVYDFRRSELGTTFFERIFHLSSKSRLVAVQNMHTIGYVEANYTTAQEAGQIANVQVLPEMRGKGIEEMLVYEAAEKIKRIGTEKIIGTVSSSRPELIAAMEKLGFKKCLELDGMFLEFK